KGELSDRGAVQPGESGLARTAAWTAKASPTSEPPAETGRPAHSRQLFVHVAGALSDIGRRIVFQERCKARAKVGDRMIERPCLVRAMVKLHLKLALRTEV